MSSLHTPPPPIEEEVWGPAQWDLFFEESVAAFGDVEMAPLEGAKIDPPLNDPKDQPEAPKECTQPQDDPFQSPVFGAENMKIKFLGGGEKQGVLQGCMDSQGKTLCIDLFVSLYGIVFSSNHLQCQRVSWFRQSSPISPGKDPIPGTRGPEKKKVARSRSGLLLALCEQDLRVCGTRVHYYKATMQV
jgi:hypothetical protein